MNKKIALFHPWIKSRGGAEKVVLELSKLKGCDVDIYTWVYDSDNTFEEFKELGIKVLGPKFMKKHSRGFISRGLFLFNSFFSKIPLEKYDIFFISTSGVGEFITFRNYKKGKTYAYCHTPLRVASGDVYSWQLKNRNFSFSKKLLYILAVKFYNLLEKIAWKRLDYIIFNSNLSKQRAINKKLIRKDANISVIFPPLNLEKFRNNKSKRKKHFIYVSRLNWDKRQDLVLDSWNIFSKQNKNFKLLLVGGIEDSSYYDLLNNKIKKLSNVEIRNNLPFSKIIELYKNSFCGLFLGYKEDFGIVPFEVLGSNMPLIAVNEGGFVDLIDNNKNVFFIKEDEDRDKMVKELGEKMNEVIRYKFEKQPLNLEDNFLEKIVGVLK